jgi:hypothetical protein
MSAGRRDRTFYIEIMRCPYPSSLAIDYRVHRSEPDRDELSPDMVELIGPVAALNQREAVATALWAGVPPL